MPVYEYYCAECRSSFDLLMSYAASEADIVCTRCHGTHVRKRFSVFASPRGSASASEYGGYSETGGDYGDDGSGGGCCGGACGCHD